MAQNGIAEKTTIDGVPAWIVYYLVHEKTSGLSDVGVTPHTAPVSLVVTVKDEGNGALSASFQTANELRFDNTYSTGEPATVFLAGTKDLQVEEGASLVDIEGKFRFAISTKDIAAPMPESTDAGNLGHDFAMMAGLVFVALVVEVIFLRPKTVNMTDK